MKRHVAFSTKYLNDEYLMWVTANPKINNLEKDQSEQFYFNNLAQRKFTVLKDNTNPLLDVTFDGIHILNNDIVSPNPHIVIELNDENPFFPFLIITNSIPNGTADIMFLKHLGECQEQKKYVNGNIQM